MDCTHSQTSAPPEGNRSHLCTNISQHGRFYTSFSHKDFKICPESIVSKTITSCLTVLSTQLQQTDSIYPCVLVLRTDASSKQQRAAFRKWNMNTEKTFTQQVLAKFMQEAHKGPRYKVCRWNHQHPLGLKIRPQNSATRRSVPVHISHADRALARVQHSGYLLS